MELKEFAIICIDRAEEADKKNNSKEAIRLLELLKLEIDRLIEKLK